MLLKPPKLMIYINYWKTKHLLKQKMKRSPSIAAEFLPQPHLVQVLREVERLQGDQCSRDRGSDYSLADRQLPLPLKPKCEGRDLKTFLLRVSGTLAKGVTAKAGHRRQSSAGGYRS